MSTNVDLSYLHVMQHILNHGEERMDRTGTGAVSIFGPQLVHNMRKGFPLLTTKKLHWRSIAVELVWFIRGFTNTQYLRDNGVTIWDEWADENGDLGPVYGKQWRDWAGVDQLAGVVESLRTNPYGRRHLVSAWNVGELDQMRLPPCHLLQQYFVNEQGLSLQVYQRSADWFLGVPFNLASYGLLLSIVARLVGLQPHRLIYTFGDAHLYRNHLEQAHEQLSREPRALPKLLMSRRSFTLNNIESCDFSIDGYDPHPRIKAPVAI